MKKSTYLLTILLILSTISPLAYLNPFPTIPPAYAGGPAGDSKMLLICVGLIPSTPDCVDDTLAPFETVVYDADNSITFTSGDTVIVGAVPTTGQALADEPNVRYRDTTAGTGTTCCWGMGEMIFYDQDGVLTTTNDRVTLIGTPSPSALLVEDDPLIRFADANGNSRLEGVVRITARLEALGGINIDDTQEDVDAIQVIYTFNSGILTVMRSAYPGPFLPGASLFKSPVRTHCSGSGGSPLDTIVVDAGTASASEACTQGPPRDIDVGIGCDPLITTTGTCPGIDLDGDMIGDVPLQSVDITNLQWMITGRGAFTITHVRTPTTGSEISDIDGLAPTDIPLLLVNAEFDNRAAVVNDVAVTNVAASPLSVTRPPDVTVTITVDVANQGTASETFDVTAFAGSTTVGTQTVSNLAASSTQTLTFTLNTATLADSSYLIRAEASTVTGETDTSDNIRADGTLVVSTQVTHDVAVTDVTASPLAVTRPPDTMVTINVNVANQGTATETFTVTAFAGSNTIGSQTVTSLAAGGTQTLTFMLDTATLADGSYLIRAQASTVSGETDTADNTRDDGTLVVSTQVIHDVAVTDITAAPLSVTRPPDQNVLISVSVANQGSATETFTVTLFFGSITVGTQTVADIGAGAARSLNFMTNTAPLADGSYLIRAEASVVTGETDTADNSRDDGTLVVSSQVIHDVAVTNVAASTLAVTRPPDVTVTITVDVANQGTATEIFTVTAFAGTVTVGTQTVSNLAAGTSTSLTFTINTSTLADGNYLIRAEASTVTGETDTADNTRDDGTLAVSTFVEVHDVAVTDVTATPLNVLRPPDVDVTISVQVANQGTVAETFTVTAFAGSLTVGSQTVTSLGPGSSTTLTFTINTATLADASYLIRAEASTVAGETDTADNMRDDGTLVVAPRPPAPTAVIQLYDDVIAANRLISGQVLFVTEEYIFDASQSLDPTGLGLTYMWDFGDGTTASGVMATHTYTIAGAFTVTLRVMDPSGGSDTDTVNVTVHNEPRLIRGKMSWRHHLLEGDTQTFIAKARNDAGISVIVKLKVVIESPAGTIVGMVESADTPLAIGETNLAITATWTPAEYGDITARTVYQVTGTLTYTAIDPVTGNMITGTDAQKTGSFAIVPT